MKARLIGGRADGQVVEVDPREEGFDVVVSQGAYYRWRPELGDYFRRQDGYALDTVQESYVQQAFSADLIPVLEPGEAFDRLDGRLEDVLDGKRILSLPVRERWYDAARFSWVYRVRLLTEPQEA